MKINIYIMALLAAFAIPAGASAQDGRDRVAEAVQLMDNGDIERSTDILYGVLHEYPKDYVANYELGYAYYIKGDYTQAGKIFGRISRSAEVTDRLYQMWGNSRDLHGKPDKAVKIYRKGLERFPESGCLRMEMGTMAFNDGRYDEALKWYEQGIAVAPQYPTNYMRAAVIYMNSTERVWGMIYGELFMNMVCNDEQNLTMSCYLADAYAKGITASKNEAGEDVIVISFSENSEIAFDRDSGTAAMPYGIAVYEPTLGVAVVETGIPPFGTDQLSEVRRRFLDIYFDEESGPARMFPNLLFERQREIAEAGHFEAYTRWILRGGDEPAFDAWRDAHQKQWSEFVGWFNTHPLTIDDDHRFHSCQYSSEPDTALDFMQIRSAKRR